MQAKDLYQGAFFKCLYGVAITLDPDVRILSAGYGLLMPNDLVRYYNKKMDEDTARLLRGTFLNLPQHTGHLLPKMYASALRGTHAVALLPPVKGMGYFMQEAVKIKRDKILAPLHFPNGPIRTLLSNYKGV